MTQLHRLLQRQLKRYIKASATSGEWQDLIGAVSEAYQDFDTARLMTERALDLSSHELFQANSELRGVLQALPDRLFRIGEDNRLTDLAQAGGAAFELPFSTLDEDPANPSPSEAASLFRNAAKQVRETRTSVLFEYRSASRGLVSYFEARLLPFVGQDLIGIVRDITTREQAEESRRLAEEQVRWQAYHDPLTGLPNRSLFRDRLEQALVSAKSGNRLLAVLFLDLDRFKHVNDSLGHAAGDSLLQQVATRLQASLRPHDTLARMGGDEFTILLPRLESPDDAGSIAQRVLDALEPPFAVCGRDVFVESSVGVSHYPSDGCDAEALLQHAAVAMYRVKSSGGRSYHCYAKAVDAVATERLGLESDLRRALDAGQFLLLYQPQIDLGTNQMVGAEALVRWKHPELGMVSPARFIPLAEESGLISRLGEWVLREACRQAAAWRSQGLSLRVAVNLSARQFEHSNLPRLVEEILHDCALPPHLLEFELTESAIIRQPEAAIDILNTLRSLGVSLSVDDFGTGYSSLSYLKRLPLDVLKIDRSFVQDLAGAEDSSSAAAAGRVWEHGDRRNPEQAVVQAIISLAHALGLKVVGEGVETEQQRQVLRHLNCDRMQGFLFCPPVLPGHVREIAEAAPGSGSFSRSFEPALVSEQPAAMC